jgi:type IV pilus assembly protein PilN
MPRINLIPLKAARRQVTARNEMFAMAGMVGATLVGLVFWYTSVDGDLDAAKSRLSAIDADIIQLTEEVKQVESLQAKEKKVKKKLEVIRSLIANRSGPARMMDELANILTNESKRVWLTRMQQKEGGAILLEGGAMDHEDISEFQLALERREQFGPVTLKQVTMKKPQKGKTTDEPAHLIWELSTSWVATTGGTG